MTTEQKKQLNSDRQTAVRHAWSREQLYVSHGYGTVDWTPEQQKELLENGSVKGFEGQHMKSVAAHPEWADSTDNIQLLSHEDHLAAHNSGEIQSGYRSPTNGYYDAETGTMYSFGDDPPQAPDPFELSETYVNTREQDVDLGWEESVESAIDKWLAAAAETTSENEEMMYQ